MATQTPAKIVQGDYNISKTVTGSGMTIGTARLGMGKFFPTAGNSGKVLSKKNFLLGSLSDSSLGVNFCLGHLN